MKKLSRCAFALAFCSGIIALSANARPIEFSEVSLLVRSHEEPSDILREVQTRKLPQPLSANQESALRAQGADDALLRELHNRALVLSPEQAASFAQEQERAANIARPAAPPRSRQASACTSSKSPTATRSTSANGAAPRAKSPSASAAMGAKKASSRSCSTDPPSPPPIRGQGRPDDSTTIFDRREYVSAISYDRSRPGSIDLNNPVVIKGVPYNLYPVCGAGGVSLYYIGKSGGAVRLAVVISKA